MGHVALVVGFLVLLEGMLSFDNALALAAMVKHLAPVQQMRALTYGIGGAFLFRATALLLIRYLLDASMWVDLCAAGYLLWLASSYFFQKEESQQRESVLSHAQFWKTVFLVEMT